MIDLDVYAHGIRAALDECHERLSPLENGEMYIGKRVGGGDWQDITGDTIDGHKKMIVTYEGILRILAAKSQDNF